MNETCKHGHLWSETTFLNARGDRECRECVRKKIREFQRHKRAAIPPKKRTMPSGPASASWQDGRSKHPLYGTWRDMLRRCSDPKATRWERYGGRGISVAPEWLTDFWAFAEHIGPKPDDGQRWSVDRIDNDGNYEPGNVRWATASQQTLNQSRAPKLQCPAGHDYSITGFSDSAGYQRCRQCRRDRDKHED